MKKTLLILGAGYGGLMTAVKLEDASKRLDDVEIVLVDRNDYHQYVHLSYEIVTGVKKVADLTVPMSELLRNRRIRFVQATVSNIDLANKTVKTDKGDMPYDKLVIALGSEPNYFHIKGADNLSMHLSSVEDAVKIQDRIKALFALEKEPRIVVGGGGFTGVELAGEIADEFRCCVTIVEASNMLLPGWKIPEFSQKVAQVLSNMGATMVFSKFIAEVKPDAIVLNDGAQMPCSLFIWTGGVQASRIASKSGLKTGKSNRVIINEFCEAEGFPGVYVVGDCALVADPTTGEVMPQCVEIALQQAEVVSRNVLADVVGKPKTIFTPKFSGLIVAVGENYGVGRIFGVEVEGRLAQMVKRLIHLRYVYEVAGLRKVFDETL